MPKKFLLTIFTLLLLLNSATARVASFKLEDYNFCPDLTGSIAQFNSDDMKVQISRNHISVVGSGNVTQALKKPLEMHVKTMKCMTVTKCKDDKFIKIPQICNLMKMAPFGNVGLGDYFSPRIRCPVAAGQYKVNISHDLDYFAVIPLGSQLYKLRIVLYEVVNPQKKRLVLCLGGVLRTISALSKT